MSDGRYLSSNRQAIMLDGGRLETYSATPITNKTAKPP